MLLPSSWAPAPYSQKPQPTLLPQCERPSCKPIQNNMQTFISVYLNHYIFGSKTGKQIILQAFPEFIVLLFHFEWTLIR